MAWVGKIQFKGVHSREPYTCDAWKTVKKTQILKSIPDWKEKKGLCGLCEVSMGEIKRQERRESWSFQA